jgi:ribonuclease P protein component
MSRYSFPPAARVQNKRDFDRIYRRGFRVWVYPLGAQVLPRQSGRSRLGLSVSKKVGGSVVRNRWKRSIREAFRLNRHRLDVPCDMVVMVNWDAPEEAVEEVEDAFCEMVGRINDRCGRGKE